MINTIKDLKDLFKLCRKDGVDELTIGDLNIKFGDLPDNVKISVSDSDSINPYAGFPEGELSPDQLAFYSAGGMPEDDPYLKAANQ